VRHPSSLFRVPKVRFLSSLNHQILSSGTELGSASHTKGILLPSRAYQADGGRQFLVWDFLNEGLAPLRLDEDAPAATAQAVVVAAKVARTFQILEEGVSLIDVNRVLIPFLMVRS
jgi:hypothetical protein